MLKPPIPANEEERLRALARYAILDSEADPRYDDLTQLAVNICGMPIALISLVDAERQWFKSRVGLDVQQTARDLAFCAHAIQRHDLFVIADTHADERFADHPLVTGEPHIRFYAGAPLVTPDDLALGTMCVIDRRPRQLTEVQAWSLRVLAQQVVAQMELSRYESRATETSHELRTPLTAIRGSLGLLANGAGGALPQEAMTLVTLAERNSGRLLHAIDALLRP